MKLLVFLSRFESWFNQNMGWFLTNGYKSRFLNQDGK
jgi:hypothetical protein